MTARELLKAFQELAKGHGDEALDKEVIMFDGPSWYTPYKIEILGKDWGERLQGKIMID